MEDIPIFPMVSIHEKLRKRDTHWRILWPVDLIALNICYWYSIRVATHQPR